MTWIAKLFVIVMATFMGQHATNPPTAPNEVPGTVRSLLWSCYFSSATSKPPFIQRWDKEQEQKRQDLFSIALDYNNWQYVSAELPMNDLAAPSTQLKLYKLIMCNEILNEMGVPVHKRIGLLRYMMEIASVYVDEMYETNDHKLRVLLPQLHMATKTINLFLAHGARDFGNWCKTEGRTDYYLSNLDSLIRHIPISNRLGSGKGMQRYTPRFVTQSAAMDILRSNRDLKLLPIIASQPDSNVFVFVDYIASHFVSYSARVLKLFAIDARPNAWDVYSPATDKIEALITCSKHTFAVLERYGGMHDLAQNPGVLCAAIEDAQNEVAKLSSPTQSIGSVAVRRIYEVILLLFIWEHRTDPTDKQVARMRQHAVFMETLLMLSAHLEFGKFCSGSVVFNWFAFGYMEPKDVVIHDPNLMILNTLLDSSNPLNIQKLYKIEDEKEQLFAGDALIESCTSQWSTVDGKKGHADIVAIIEKIQHLIKAFADHLFTTDKVMLPGIASLLMCIPRRERCESDELVSLIFNTKSIFKRPYQDSILLPFHARDEMQIVHPYIYSFLDGVDATLPESVACPLFRAGQSEAKTDKSVRKRALKHDGAGVDTAIDGFNLSDEDEQEPKRLCV